MSIALLVFGQFRAYEEVFEANILELKKSFLSFDIFILTDKLPSGLYSEEAEKYIRHILDKHNVRIKLFSYWEDLKDLHATDKLMGEFSTKFINKINASPENLWMVNLWYRRYILWKLFENMNESYDCCVFARPFDTTIQFLKPITLEIDTLYTCVDTFFVGSPPIMKKLFMFGSTLKWDNSEWPEDFWKAFATFDEFIANSRNTLCSESQVFYYIYNNIKWKNIRWDFTSTDSPSHNEAVFHIRHKRACRIPKKIIQIALGEEYRRNLPSSLKDNLLFMNDGFEYIFLDEYSSESFIRTNFPEFLSLYNSIQRVQYKSDLIRYLYLYKEGGFYIDIDTFPLLPLTTIYEKTQLCKSFFFLGANTNPAKGTLEVHNGFFGTIKNNPLIWELIEAFEANPEDYGNNVKILYKRINLQNPSMTLFENVKDIYLFHEVNKNGKYYMAFKDEDIAIGNGHGYPSLNSS